MQVNMLDAKNKLSSLVAAVEKGEEVILARGGVAVAKIVRYERPKIKPPGAWKGLVSDSDDWDSPQTNALVGDLFYGAGSPSESPALHEPKALYRAKAKPAQRATSVSNAKRLVRSSGRATPKR